MDLEELDKGVLAEAAALRGASGPTTNPTVARKAAFIAKHIAKTDRTRLGSNPPPAPPRGQQRK
jgi:hypothetical protein